MTAISLFSALFLLMLGLSLATQLWLTFRHMNHVKAHQGKVPDAFSDKISLEDH